MDLKASPEAAHLTFFVLLLCSCFQIVRYFNKKRWLNESITSLAVGIIAGTVVLLTTGGKSSHILEFNEQLFFIYLLPPIIFNAGFQVKKKQFFHNFLTIILFGAFGSVISFAIISLGSLHLLKKLDVGFLDMRDYFALGAILSATDSVCTLQILNQKKTPLLYSLVFGEGVVNDATSVVLFNAMQKFDLSHITSTNAIQLAGSFLSLFLKSTSLGLAVGLLCAYIMKKHNEGEKGDEGDEERDSTKNEYCTMIMMSYLSYMIAEMFVLNGILSAFFCGIAMSHYTWHNVTESSKLTTRGTFKGLSYAAEIFIFLYVGMDALDIDKWNVVRMSPGTSVGASLILLGLVLVGRAAFVFPLSFISNLTRKSKNGRIGFKQQVTIWWAGLMRGAVSVALAYNQFSKSGQNQLRGASMMITSTITIVLFTNVVCGLFTKLIIRRLIPRVDNTTYANFPTLQALSEPLLPNDIDLESNMEGTNLPRPNRLRLLLTFPTQSIHYYWQKFDDHYMHPVFVERGASLQSPSTIIMP